MDAHLIVPCQHPIKWRRYVLCRLNGQLMHPKASCSAARVERCAQLKTRQESEKELHVRSLCTQ